jgi:hypothetical protein
MIEDAMVFVQPDGRQFKCKVETFKYWVRDPGHIATPPQYRLLMNADLFKLQDGTMIEVELHNVRHTLVKRRGFFSNL